jgi:hypothetical protein
MINLLPIWILNLPDRVYEILLIKDHSKNQNIFQKALDHIQIMLVITLINLYPNF